MKKFWKSKTLWFNAATLGCYGAKQYFGVEQLPDPDPTVVALVNVLLRFVTKKPIGL